MSEILSGKHKLRLWEALALSVGLMAPTLAMALNGVGVAGLVGKSVPLVFVMGFVGVALVAYGFVRLTRYFNHAGSVYALAGATIGPRAGFFGGFALIGTYAFFAISTLAATGVFLNAFLDEVGWHVHPSWLLAAVVANIIVVLLNMRESRVTARTLFTAEGIGIITMLFLCVVIVARVASGNAPGHQKFDFSAFAPGHTSTSTLLTATVFAFLSWAGFEACAALGEETDNPRRNIPGALVGALLITGVLFVFVMFAQTVGFGTDAKGTAAFASSQSSLVDLGKMYLNSAVGSILAFTALLSSIASILGSTTACSRLVFALGRDGFGPKALARTDKRTGAPIVAVLTVATVTMLAAIGFWAKGSSPFNVYYWTATLGVLCLLVVYAVAAAGVIVFTLRGKGNIAKWETIIPALAVVYLVYVFYKQSVGQPDPFNRLPYIAGAWCVIGVVIVLVAPGLARRIGDRLSGELARTGSDVEEMERPRLAREDLEPA